MMKKIILFLTLATLPFLFNSCGTDAKDIQVSDLETPCDYVDAWVQCVEEMIEIKGDKKDESEFSAEEKAEYEAVEDKMREIRKAARKNYSLKEVKECENFKKLDELKDKLRD
jgi:hypothetical protein